MMNAEVKSFSIHHSSFPSRGFGNFASLDATGADLHALDASLRTLHADGLQVWIEATARPIVRVGNIIAELRAFAADFASFSHDYRVPPNIRKRIYYHIVQNR